MKKWFIGIQMSCLLGIGTLGQPSLQGADTLIDLNDRAQIEKRRPIIIAHRGGVVRDDSPECSLAAIRLAAEAGYAMVELDIQRSRDDVPIVFHDETLKQACDVEGSVEDYSAVDLVKIHYTGSNHKIVRLDSALSLCRKLHLGVMLDLKAGRDDKQFLRKIDEMIVDRTLAKAAVSISGSSTAREELRHVMFTPTSNQMAQFRKGEKVDLRGTFWFGLPNRLPSADVGRLQESGALVFPAINTFRYPSDRHLDLAREDMARLMSAGVDGFQIDSVYRKILKSIAPLTSRAAETVTEPHTAKLDYRFDEKISRAVLENYLARSATVASLLHLASDDDLRMIQSTGVKFAGRVIWMWGSESRINTLVEKGEPFVKRIHEVDPDIILQGAIFEIITTDVNNVSIPASVFEEFGLKPETRNFRYKDMIYPMGHRVDHWRKGASVPDMSRLETRMWFVYVGKRWIDMGLEAIHFGQVEIMDDRDKDHAHWRDMMARLRSYAKKHARRHMVLADAHVPSGGIVHDGKLMFDLHSFPSRPKSVKGKPYQAILEKGFSDSIYGRSIGGLTPSGWSCKALPYIVEIDNFGSSDHPGQYRASDRFHVWGWDEIGWFIKQPEAYRNEWLEYAYQWVRETDPNGFFQLPLRRFEHYTASMTPPKGQRQEETIKTIWAASDKR